MLAVIWFTVTGWNMLLHTAFWYRTLIRTRWIILDSMKRSKHVSDLWMLYFNQNWVFAGSYGVHVSCSLFTKRGESLWTIRLYPWMLKTQVKFSNSNRIFSIYLKTPCLYTNTNIILMAWQVDVGISGDFLWFWGYDCNRVSTLFPYVFSCKICNTWGPLKVKLLTLEP